MDTLNQLPDLCRLRWTLCFEQTFEAPSHLGSALRGLLGHGLRAIACVTRQGQCQGCSLVESCVFTDIFETAARSGDSTKPPYVLDVPITHGEHYEKGGRFSFEMTLISPYQKHLPYLVHAFQRGGRLGLGPDNVIFHVAGLERLAALGGDDWSVIFEDGKLIEKPETSAVVIPPKPPSVQLEWITPWRLKRRGYFVGPKSFEPTMLLEALLFRFSELEGSRPSSAILNEVRGRHLRADYKLFWRDWYRYSSRQKTRMKVGGLMGQISLVLDDMDEWWPLLWLGQWVHLGKFTSMGLGRYRLNFASLPETRK